MDSTHHRWMKFWPQDFESDPALKMCSMAAQGLWIRMICRLHEGTPYGHLTIGGRPITPDMLAKLVGVSIKDVQALLKELRDNGVFSETEDGVILSRRMVRDAHHAEAGRAAVTRRWDRQRAHETPSGALPSRGGNAPFDGERISLPFSPPNREAHTGSITQETESESDLAPQGAALEKSARSGKRGTRLPDNWQPGDVDREYAAALGLDVPRVTEDFRSYWLAKAGKDAVKVDWSLTWQGWCRRAADWHGPQQKPEEKKTGFLL